jgi:hypothetical protein
LRGERLNAYGVGFYLASITAVDAVYWSTNTTDVADSTPPDEVKAVAARLAEAFEFRERTEGMTKGKLADMVGMRPNSITDMLAGTRDPGHQNISKVMLALRVWPNYVSLGILPKYFEDSAGALQPVSLPTGTQLDVDRWLVEHPELSSDDRAFLRAYPWRDPSARKSDAAYLMVLATHKTHSRLAKPDGKSDGHRKTE